jgi:DNA (cytosine-5)-methyltransferase 1
MAPGDRYPEALAIAHRLFQAKLDQLGRRSLDPGSKAYQELKAAYVPPYRNDAFDQKWGKLIPDQPAWTVTAHLSRDTYSHIHYSSPQARTISVREAARLQSFPDSVNFQGNFGEQLHQIGNAVPPLLAKAIGEMVLLQLNKLEE